MRDTKHEDGGALFRGDLQPKTERRRDGFPADKRQLAEIQRDESETRAAREEISRAEGCAQPPAALHPEQSREVDPGGNGGDGIECIRSIHEGDLIAGGRAPGHQGQEQTAASLGPGADNLAELPRGEGAQQEVDPSRTSPWRRQGFVGDGHDRHSKAQLSRNYYTSYDEYKQELDHEEMGCNTP